MHQAKPNKKVSQFLVTFCIWHPVVLVEMHTERGVNRMNSLIPRSLKNIGFKDLFTDFGAINKSLLPLIVNPPS